MTSADDRTCRKRVAWAARRTGVLVCATALGAGLLSACGSGSGPTTVDLYLAPEQHMQDLVDRCNEEAGGRYRIVYHKLPREADGQREQLVRRLAAEDSGMDVLGLDVTWTPEFAEAGWIEPWTGERRKKAVHDVLPGPLKTVQWNGRVYAATKNTNVQLLWYDDRVVPKPPDTWQQMIETAKKLKAQGKPHRILFTGAQYEGLVVVFNTLVESAGGHLLSKDGEKVVVDDGVVRALKMLKKVTTSGVTSPSLTNQHEDQVRQAFQRGKGAFELNWPFIYAAYQQEMPPEDAKHLHWARYPSLQPGEPPRTTIGGFNLAVSTYSRHKPAAFDAALCLRSPRSQKYQALKDGLPPSLASVYEDETPLDPDRPADPQTNPTMATEYPMKDDIRAALENAAVRPATPVYQNISTIISHTLSPPSAIRPEKTAQKLRKQLTAALNSQAVLP
ncbi:MAG TPA: ABC transporter substrate-binding protein [Streptomyces sp.]|nr:ABC transporter substrate-binding protein [Streptomyces sp.]